MLFMNFSDTCLNIFYYNPNPSLLLLSKKHYGYFFDEKTKKVKEEIFNKFLNLKLKISSYPEEFKNDTYNKIWLKMKIVHRDETLAHIANIINVGFKIEVKEKITIKEIVKKMIEIQKNDSNLIDFEVFAKILKIKYEIPVPTELKYESFEKIKKQMKMLSSGIKENFSLGIPLSYKYLSFSEMINRFHFPNQFFKKLVDVFNNVIEFSKIPIVNMIKSPIFYMKPEELGEKADHMEFQMVAPEDLPKVKHPIYKGINPYGHFQIVIQYQCKKEQKQNFSDKISKLYLKNTQIKSSYGAISNEVIIMTGFGNVRIKDNYYYFVRVLMSENSKKYSLSQKWTSLYIIKDSDHKDNATHLKLIQDLIEGKLAGYRLKPEDEEVIL